MDRKHCGMALILAAIGLVFAGVLVLAVQAAAFSSARRDQASERTLSQAREALLAYASDRPINAIVGPGFLPCPDLDDDGWAEATCGSQSGDTGQEQRLGRLPWKTLGLPDLRDGYGERLWYAVSSKHKGLLNCAASRACVDMSPPSALGTISVRDAAGMLLFDGAAADATLERTGAAAVVIAPGPALTRRARPCNASARPWSNGEDARRSAIRRASWTRRRMRARARTTPISSIATTRPGGRAIPTASSRARCTTLRDAPS